jgi:hypothetical protein
MGIEPTGKVLPELQNKRFPADADTSMCETLARARQPWLSDQSGAVSGTGIAYSGHPRPTVCWLPSGAIARCPSYTLTNLRVHIVRREH